MLQFGSAYGGTEDEAKQRQARYNFKLKFMKRLKEVITIYPAAKNAVVKLDNGLMVKQAPLHIKQAPARK